MNRRDEFAAHTLPALMEAYPNWLPHQLASRAYEIADAMIAASPPSAEALRDTAYSIAQSFKAYLLSELTLSEAWRGLNNDTRKNMMDGFTDATRRHLLRFFTEKRG